MHRTKVSSIAKCLFSLGIGLFLFFFLHLFFLTFTFVVKFIFVNIDWSIFPTDVLERGLKLFRHRLHHFFNFGESLDIYLNWVTCQRCRRRSQLAKLLRNGAIPFNFNVSQFFSECFNLRVVDNQVRIYT